MTFMEFFKRLGEIAEMIKQSVLAIEEEMPGTGQGKTKKEIIMEGMKNLIGNETLWNRVIALIVSFLINSAAKKGLGSTGEDPA